MGGSGFPLYAFCHLRSLRITASHPALLGASRSISALEGERLRGMDRDLQLEGVRGGRLVDDAVSNPQLRFSV